MSSCGQIDAARVQGLLRKNAMGVTPDGFPRGGMGDRGSPGGHSTPTEGAMMARNQDLRVCMNRECGNSFTATDKVPNHAPCPNCGGPTQLRIVEREVQDELRETVRGIERNVAEAERLLAAVVDSLSYIAEVDEETQGRSSSLPCEVCLLLPATKAGWCEGCHRDWEQEHGRPDRARYVMWKQETKNSEGLLLVSECPPSISERRVLVSASP